MSAAQRIELTRDHNSDTARNVAQELAADIVIVSTQVVSRHFQSEKESAF